MKDFIIDYIFNTYKDKHFKTSSKLRYIFMNKYNLTYEESSRLIIKIINYQVKRYGCQLYKG